MIDTVRGEAKIMGTFFFECFQSVEIQYLMPLSSTGTFIEMLNKLSLLICLDFPSIATVNNRIYTKWMSRTAKLWISCKTGDRQEIK